jgi:hypothetical protein
VRSPFPLGSAQSHRPVPSHKQPVTQAACRGERVRSWLAEKSHVYRTTVNLHDGQSVNWSRLLAVEQITSSSDCVAPLPCFVRTHLSLISITKSLVKEFENGECPSSLKFGRRGGVKIAVARDGEHNHVVAYAPIEAGPICVRCQYAEHTHRALSQCWCGR